MDYQLTLSKFCLQRLLLLVMIKMKSAVFLLLVLFINGVSNIVVKIPSFGLWILFALLLMSMRGFCCVMIIFWIELNWMKTAAAPPMCPADVKSDCANGSGEWEGEFFPGIPKIKYEVFSSNVHISCFSSWFCFL